MLLDQLCLSSSAAPNDHDFLLPFSLAFELRLRTRQKKNRQDNLRGSGGRSKQFHPVEIDEGGILFTE